MARRRPVFRVFVSWGGRRPRPAEYNFAAQDVATAMRLALGRARADRLPPPHEVDGVVHLCDLDRPADRRRVR